VIVLFGRWMLLEADVEVLVVAEIAFVAGR
jgi:hypothetical protein